VSALVFFAGLIFAIHLAVIAFNVFWLIAIPLGAWQGWNFVRIFGWRRLHVLSLSVVAFQALMGQACFLTIWHASMTTSEPERPLIAEWVSRLIFWPLPLWVFTVLYCAIFAYTLALWFLVPPRRRGRGTA